MAEKDDNLVYSNGLNTEQRRSIRATLFFFYHLLMNKQNNIQYNIKI